MLRYLPDRDGARVSVHVAVPVLSGEVDGRLDVRERYAGRGNEACAGTDNADAHEPVPRIVVRAGARASNRHVPVIGYVGPGEGEGAFEQVVVGG